MWLKVAVNHSVIQLAGRLVGKFGGRIWTYSHRYWRTFPRLMFNSPPAKGCGLGGGLCGGRLLVALVRTQACSLSIPAPLVVLCGGVVPAAISAAGGEIRRSQARCVGDFSLDAGGVGPCAAPGLPPPAPVETPGDAGRVNPVAISS